MKDRFIAGALAGAVGAIAMYLFAQGLDLIGVVKYGQSRLAGDTVFNYKPTLFLQVIAVFITLFIGAFWGVILSFLFSKVLTPRYYMLKGALFGFALFLLNLGILDEYFKYPKELQDRPVDILVISIGYLIYGAVTALVIKRLRNVQDLKS